MRTTTAALLMVLTCVLVTAAPAAAETGSCREGQWQNVATPNGQVRFWWRADSPSAKRDEAEAKAWTAEMHHRVWPGLTGLMGEPLNDALQACNGGDGALDVWLTSLPGSDRGAAYGYDGACDLTPAWLEVDPTKATRWTVAHEFFHALQLRYDFPTPCQGVVDGKAVNDDQAWLNESTAAWAAHWVYPRDNDEHRYGELLEAPWRPLNHGWRTYDAWVFFLYSQLRTGDAEQVVRKSYENTTKQPTSLDAVNHALPGNFKHHWPQFALYGWNQSPLDDSFRKWDDVKTTPLARTAKPLRVQRARLGTTPVEPEVSLYPLSRHYSKFRVDPGVRYLEVHNTLQPYAEQGASLQALIKVGGQWRLPSDWSTREKVTFCRDKRSENVTEIVLIAANWKHDGRLIKPAKPPKFVGTRRCAKPKPQRQEVGLYEAQYSGTATGHVEYFCDGAITRLFRDDTSVKWTMHGGKRIELRADDYADGRALPEGSQTEASTTHTDIGPSPALGIDPPPDTYDRSETVVNGVDEEIYLRKGDNRRELVAVHPGVYEVYGEEQFPKLTIPPGKLRASYTFPVSGERDHETECPGTGHREFSGTWTLKRVR